MLCIRISIGLEEMGLEYNVHQVFLGGEQFTPEFTALNPNRKIPVLVKADTRSIGSVSIGASLEPAEVQSSTFVHAWNLLISRR